MGPFSAKLRAKATRTLEQLGVQVRVGTMVTDVCNGHVLLKSGDRWEKILTHTVLWAAGVQAVPLADNLARQTGAAQDRGGRVMVQPDLSIEGYPEILVIGDLACSTHQFDRPLPGVAAVAIQQGRYVARLITGEPDP